MKKLRPYVFSLLIFLACLLAACGSPATSVSPAVPNTRPFVSTLTLEQFTAMMRSGVKPDDRAFPETMPWENALKMNDEDLAGLYAYLTTQP